MHDRDIADSSLAAGVLMPVDPSGPGRGVMKGLAPEVRALFAGANYARPPLLAVEVGLVTGALAASAPKSCAGSPHAGAAVASPHATRTRVS